jgi:hypothetical protein
MRVYRVGFVASSGLVRAQGKILCLSIGGDNLAQYMGREEYLELQYVKK